MNQYMEKLKEYFKENDRCPNCKGIDTERKSIVYDNGDISDNEQCKCFDCGWNWLLV